MWNVKVTEMGYVDDDKVIMKAEVTRTILWVFKFRRYYIGKGLTWLNWYCELATGEDRIQLAASYYVTKGFGL